jgi:hypothetical protein
MASLSESRLTEANVNFLQDWVYPMDNNLVEEVIAKTSKDNWFEFELHGIPIGRLAAYEVLLQNKLGSLSLNETQWVQLKSELANLIRVTLSATRYLRENTFDRVVVYNNFYGVNRVVTRVALDLGIPIYSIQASGFNHAMYDSIAVYSSDEYPFLFPRSSEVAKRMQTPLGSLEIREVIKHLEGLFTSKNAWVYSDPIQKGSEPDFITNLMEIRKGRELVLLSLSSADEMFAARVTGVKLPNIENHEEDQQMDGLQECIEYFRQNPDLLLIIRPHPREFPNKREGVLSQNAMKLRSYLKNLPPNILVNWPEDNTAIYAFIPHVDLLINNSSSTGLEFTAFGVKTLILDPSRLYIYPPIIGNARFSGESLGSAIRRTLSEASQITQQAAAFRFIYVSRSSGVFQEFGRGKTISRSFLPFFRRLASRIPSFWLIIFSVTLRKFGNLSKLRNGNSSLNLIIHGKSELTMARPSELLFHFSESELKLIKDSTDTLKSKYGLK